LLLSGSLQDRHLFVAQSPCAFTLHHFSVASNGFLTLTMLASYFLAALTAVCSTFAAPLYPRAQSIRYVILDTSNGEAQGLDAAWMAMFRQDVKDALILVEATLHVLNDPKFTGSDLYQAFIDREYPRYALAQVLCRSNR
jgi:hypothetical protein